MNDRTTYLGGSDAAAAVGLNPHVSRFALWLEKTGQLPARPETEAMRWGKTLEPIVLGEALHSLGHDSDDWLPQAEVAHPDHPWMRGHIDCVTRIQGHLSIIEAKTVGGWSADDWQDGPPDWAAIQVHHYLACTGYARGYVAALIGGQRLVIHPVDRDPRIEDLLVEQEAAFWRMVEERTPPPVDGLEATSEALKAAFRGGEVQPEPVQATPEIMQAIGEYKDVRSEIAALELRQEKAANIIRASLGEATDVVLDGKAVATWRPVVSRRLSVDRVKAEHPEVYAECLAEQRTRRLVVK